MLPATTWQMDTIWSTCKNSFIPIKNFQYRIQKILNADSQQSLLCLCVCLLIAAFYCLITAVICQMLDARTAATNSDRSPLSAFCLTFVSDRGRNMGYVAILEAPEVSKIFCKKFHIIFFLKLLPPSHNINTQPPVDKYYNNWAPCCFKIVAQPQIHSRTRYLHTWQIWPWTV